MSPRAAALCDHTSGVWIDPDDPPLHHRNTVTGRNRGNRCGRYLQTYRCHRSGIESGGICIWKKLRTGLSLYRTVCRQPGQDQDPDSGGGGSSRCRCSGSRDRHDPREEGDRLSLKECSAVPDVYRALHRQLQRDDPCGDALGLCSLRGGTPVLCLPVAGDGKGGNPGTVVRLPDLSGRDILPGQLGQAVFMGAPESVQLSGGENIWNIRG